MVSGIFKVISKTLNPTTHRIVDTRLIFILLCSKPLARRVCGAINVMRAGSAGKARIRGRANTELRNISLALRFRPSLAQLGNFDQVSGTRCFEMPSHIRFWSICLYWVDRQADVIKQASYLLGRGSRDNSHEGFTSRAYLRNCLAAI